MKYIGNVLVLSSLLLIGCVPSPQSVNINCQTFALSGNGVTESINLDALRRQKGKHITGLLLVGIEKEELLECVITYTLNNNHSLTYVYNETVGLPIYGQIGWSPTNWYAPTPSVWRALGSQIKDFEMSSITITIFPSSTKGREITVALSVFPE